jgi:hypothetical protein
MEASAEMDPGAEAICERCGDFAPLQRSWDRRVCEACLARRHPAELQPLSFTSLIRGTVRVAGELGFPLLGFALVYAAAASGSDLLFGDLGLVASVLLDAISVDLFYPVLMIVAIQQIEGAPVSWHRAWAAVLRRVLLFAAINAVIGLASVVGLLMFVVGAFVLPVPLMIAPAIAAREGRLMPEALRMSAQRCRPHLRPLVGASLVWSLPLLIPAIAFVVLGVAQEPEQQQLYWTALFFPAHVLLLGHEVMAAVVYAKLPRQLPQLAEPAEPREGPHEPREEISPGSG